MYKNLFNTEAILQKRWLNFDEISNGFVYAEW